MKYIRNNSLKRLYESENSILHAASSVKCVEGFQETEQFQSPKWKCFSFEEINSENLVGRGGFSEVYKGILSKVESWLIEWIDEDQRLSVKEGYKRGSREEKPKDASDTEDDDDDDDNVDEDDDDEDDANDEDFSGDEGEEGDPEDDAEVNGGGESDDDDDDGDDDDDDDDNDDDDDDDNEDDDDEEEDDDVRQPPSKKRK